MKLLLQKILKYFAKAILAKYHPEIIGITGSVGKTSAKEAIYAVLSAKFKVRQSIKNYNNEIGVPLTLIGLASPANSLIGWVYVFVKAMKLLLKTDNNYPKILILEMAADKPGDINYLTDMANCDIGVITSIGESHLENFKNIDNVRKEKINLISKLEKGGRAVLNFDDNNLRNSIKETKAKVFSFALDHPADLIGKEIRIKFPILEKEEGIGLSFKLADRKSFAPVFMPNIISQAGVYSGLAGAAVGVIKGLNLVEISQALGKYNAPRGRMRVLNGIKKTFLIDDSYNSSPASAILALDTLGSLPNDERRFKYAVLGEMLELGSLTVSGHEEVGRAVVENKIDKLIAIGERSRDIARGAKAAGMKKDDIFYFAAPEEAGKFLENRIKTGDLILIKGSQAMRMEKIVKQLMADPTNADSLLVRQGKEWQR